MCPPSVGRSYTGLLRNYPDIYQVRCIKGAIYIRTDVPETIRLCLNCWEKNPIPTFSRNFYHNFTYGYIIRHKCFACHEFLVAERPLSECLDCLIGYICCINHFRAQGTSLDRITFLLFDTKRSVLLRGLIRPSDNDNIGSESRLEPYYM